MDEEEERRDRSDKTESETDRMWCDREQGTTGRLTKVQDRLYNVAILQGSESGTGVKKRRLHMSLC